MSRPKAEGEFALNEPREGKAAGKPGDAAALDGRHFRYVEPRANGSYLCHDHPVYHHAGLWTAAQ